MNNSVIWLAFTFLEAVGIAAVVDPVKLLEWMTPQIKQNQYSEAKPFVRFIGWVFIAFPVIVFVFAYLGRNR